MTVEEALETLKNTANRYYHAGHLSLSEDLNEIAGTFRAALREKAEREKGCDFCFDPDGDNRDNNIYIDHTHRAALTTHDVYVPINFCPMCGRELKGGE